MTPEIRKLESERDKFRDALERIEAIYKDMAAMGKIAREALGENLEKEFKNNLALAVTPSNEWRTLFQKRLRSPEKTLLRKFRHKNADCSR